MRLPRVPARLVPALLRESRTLRWFWAGGTISALGSEVTTLALPLTAIVTLHASPLQVGALGAARTAAPLLLALPAGVWVDRVRRRPLLVVTSAGGAAVLVTVPLAAWMGRLGLAQLYVVAFLAAGFAVVDAIARSSYLPSIVPVERLVEGNSLVNASASAAQVAGPGVGGLLVQALTAPGAILGDAISFVLAAGSLLLIRFPEMRPARPAASARADIGEGLCFVATHPILRATSATVATFIFFDGILMGVYLLYMSRGLHLSAGVIGLIFGFAGLGGVLAAIVVTPITRRLGVGRAIISGFVLCSSGEVLIAGAMQPVLLAILTLLAAEGLVELGANLYAINAAGVRAAITPERLLGRVVATTHLISNGMATAGLLLGGLLGETAGLRPTVVIAGLGTMLCLPWALASPLRTLQGLRPETGPPAVAEKVGEALGPGVN